MILDPESSWLPNEVVYNLDEHKTESIDAVFVASTDKLSSDSFKKLKGLYKVKNIITEEKLRNLTVCGLDGVRIDCLNTGGKKYDFLITLDNSEKILINLSGQCTEYGDVVFTKYPMLSYKLYGNRCAYILAGSDDFQFNITNGKNNTAGGPKVAKVSKDRGIIVNKRDNQMLKFRRK